MELYNVIDNDEKKLRWLSPCPGVHWAGELKRDRSFLINGESESHIGVTVFNAARSSGKSLSDMMTDRLESVNLLYRKLGSVSWRTAQSKNNSQFENINFINDEEDDGIRIDENRTTKDSNRLKFSQIWITTSPSLTNADLSTQTKTMPRTRTFTDTQN